MDFGGAIGLQSALSEKVISLFSPNRAAVKAFYRAAISADGEDNVAPGLRPQYHPNYYVARLLRCSF